MAQTEYKKKKNSLEKIEERQDLSGLISLIVLSQYWDF